MPTVRLLLLLALLMSLPSVAIAADRRTPVTAAEEATPGQRITPRTAERATPAGEGPRSASGSWWVTMGSLTIVLALILALGGVMRKQMPGIKGLLPHTVLKDLGKRPLDLRNSIQLVRCGSRILVLGISPQGLNTLAEITDPIEVDYLTGLCQPQDPSNPAASFQLNLKRFFGSPSRVVEDPPGEDADLASRRLRERLQQANEQAAQHYEAGGAA